MEISSKYILNYSFKPSNVKAWYPLVYQKNEDIFVRQNVVYMCYLKNRTRERNDQEIKYKDVIFSLYLFFFPHYI